MVSWKVDFSLEVGLSEARQFTKKQFKRGKSQMVGQIPELSSISPKEQQIWREEFALRRRFTGRPDDHSILPLANNS
jgi:hypothetical protein